MSSFTEKLVITILDKGLLAIVALFVGYWISKKLEVFRMHQQRISDLERDKVSLRNELEQAKQTLDLSFREKQLSMFYWPIYFRFIKDSAIWRIVPHLSESANAIPELVGRDIELNQILANHDEVVGYIQTNIHLAGADEKLLAVLAAYIRHVAVYKALRTSKIYDLNPIDVGEPFPNKLIEEIEIRLRRLQTQYDHLAKPRKSLSIEEDSDKCFGTG